MFSTNIITSIKARIEANVYLPAHLKKKLVSIKENSNDAVYVCYPFLFNDVFKVDNKITEDLSLAGYYYYSSLIVIDRIADGNTQEGFLIQNINIASILQEEALKILISLFGIDSEFWSFWSRRRSENEKSLLLENDLKKTEHTIVAFKEYEKIADGKSAIGKIAIDALFLLSPGITKQQYETVLAFHTQLAISNQLMDDLLDFNTDYKNKQLNWVINQWKLKVKNDESLKSRSLKKTIFIEGIASNTIDLAMLKLNGCITNATNLNLKRWEDLLKLKALKIKFQKLEIENSLTIARYRSNHSVVKIKAKTDLEKRILLAKEFIFNKQRDNGSWEEYINQGGISNIWATAFILSNLSKKTPKNIVDKGLAFLENKQRNALWSYNDTWIEDFDSTTFALLAKSVHGLPVNKTSIEKWLGYQTPEGSFSTYNNKEVLLATLNDKKIQTVEGWCGSHPCITATALYLLTKYNIDNQATISCHKYLSALNTKNSLYAYWWTNDAYTQVYYTLACLHSGSQNEADQVIESMLVPNLKQNIQEERTENLFFNGLILKVLFEANQPKYRKVIEEAMNHLLKHQLSDGSWQEGNALVVPMPNCVGKPIDKENWKLARYGTNVRCEEFNRLFTTVLCLSALESYVSK